MVRLQREVAGVVEVHFSIRVIALERRSPGRQKEQVVLTPDSEQRWPFCAEILLEIGVERDVAGVIQKQVELDFVIVGTGQQRSFELVRFRRRKVWCLC